jgi:hypothetical protein
VEIAAHVLNYAPALRLVQGHRRQKSGRAVLEGTDLEGTEVRGMVAITSVPEINVGVTGQ